MQKFLITLAILFTLASTASAQSANLLEKHINDTALIRVVAAVTSAVSHCSQDDVDWDRFIENAAKEIFDISGYGDTDALRNYWQHSVLIELAMLEKYFEVHGTFKKLEFCNNLRENLLVFSK